MAERHWIGASNGVWNSTANWSATKDGASGASVPTTGDDVFIDKTGAGTFYINANQDIGAINSLSFSTPSTGYFIGGGTSSSTTGTTWNITENLTISVAADVSIGNLNPSLTLGTAGKSITKTGGGILRRTSTAGNWGTVPINISEGGVAGANITNALGSGAITMADGTFFSCGSATTAVSLQNPITVNGNISLNSWLPASTTLATLTLTGTVNLGSAVRTITVGTSTAGNDAIISGLISGTGGFIKDGTGNLTLSGNNTGLTGSVTLNEGRLYTGDFNATTNGIPSISSLSVFNNSLTLARSDIIMTSTATETRSYNISVDGTGFVNVGGVSSGATVVHTYSGTISGTGNLLVRGAWDQPGNGSPATTRYVRVKTSSLPSTLYMLGDSRSFTVSGTPYNHFRRSIYEWTGGNYDAGTNVILDSYNSNLSTEEDRTPFQICHLGTPDTEFVLNNITKDSTGTLTTTTAVLVRFGSSTIDGGDVGDIKVKGIISQVETSIGISKQGSRKLTLSGANTYTGITRVTSGTISAQNNSAFGSSSAGTVLQDGGTIEVTSGVDLNKGALAWTLRSLSGATSLKTTSGTNSITCGAVTLATTIIVDADSGASLTINNSAAMSGAGFGITKIGLGEIGLGTFANTYTGAITVSDGILTVGNLQNTNTASSLGTGAVTSAIALTGTLKYNGTGHSTNRSITFTGSSPSLDASGSGAVTYSACTQATGARTITFTGTSTEANTFSAALSDGTGVVSIAKSGAGKWILSNATLNYTGVTTVNAGTLNLNEVPRTLIDGLVMNGGILENGTAVVTAGGASSISGGTITAILGGSSTFTVTTGATASSPAIFQPADANSNNSLTGSVIVNGEVKIIIPDALELSTGGNGMVLGSGSTVTVSATGVIKTKDSAGSVQRGRARYKNLTFQSGSTLKIGY